MITSDKENSVRKPAVCLAILIALLISCSLPGQLAATSTPLPTAAATSPMPQDLDTPTSRPPTPTPTNTASPEPTATATPSTTEIVFAAGTTAAVLQGNLQPNQVKTYTLSAEQYQPIILILKSTTNDLYLGVKAPDGSTLLDPTNRWTNWQWLLPMKGQYTIQIFGGSASSDFSLTAKVAKRIAFEPGASSITLYDRTEKGYVFSYTLRCKADQTMTVNLNVSTSAAYLDIFGLATGALLKPTAKANTWTGKLPSTQDYIIEVIPADGQVVDYALMVTVK
jgi:hypothetical protein